ncbi:MAG: DUF3324 domain-containing protein [Methylococcaceae bacterium]|nr:DUF3324 domain-containing protein [Methylococcaceae bacterium]MCI0733098.1 DUF3324 domain-containing protein [Methylococcaceae bacterium]
MSWSTAWSHGGVAIEIDTCRIPVAGHWVHFTAYTPMTSADTEYCSEIPDVGFTNVVFDYESKALRKMTVEFEITKEPEGTRIFHQDPTTMKAGTFNIPIDFTPHGPGDYLAHVTLINEGTKVDAHSAFKVGTGGSGIGSINTSTYLMVGAAALVAIYLFWPGLRQKVQRKKTGKTTV